MKEFLEFDDGEKIFAQENIERKLSLLYINPRVFIILR